MSLLPYCRMFTADTTMYRLAQRVAREMNLACKIVDYKMLENETEKYS